MKKWALLLLSCFISLNILAQPVVSPANLITEEQALEIAKYTFNSGKPYDWSDTEITVHFDEREWFVFFRPAPHNQTMYPVGAGKLIVISGDGQKVEIMHGY